MPLADTCPCFQRTDASGAITAVLPVDDGTVQMTRSPAMPNRVDGITFTNPPRLVQSAGTRTNNVIPLGQLLARTTFPVPGRPSQRPSSERFKALAGTTDSGLRGFVSPDGSIGAPFATLLVTRGAFDSQNVALGRRRAPLRRISAPGPTAISRATGPSAATSTNFLD